MNQADTTLEFLHLISQHLSGRSEFRQVEYIVEITDSIVQISHSVFVFPDRHTRKPGTKLPVLEHIIQYHYDCKLPELIPGTYKYELSAFKKSRRWTRIK